MSSRYPSLSIQSLSFALDFFAFVALFSRADRIFPPKKWLAVSQPHNTGQPSDMKNFQVESNFVLSFRISSPFI
jgi:hypothetical protein